MSKDLYIVGAVISREGLLYMNLLVIVLYFTMLLLVGLTIDFIVDVFTLIVARVVLPDDIACTVG
jgi:hypothetical protein